MLLQAMDSFQVAKREHKENVKAQYTDKTGTDNRKTYFRASELGQGDRKIIYGFFAHQLPKKSKSAKNLRQLENGDYVHERYQTAWADMGVLVSMEERLSSKDDEYLSQYPWEWAGHYDGLLDINILRAHALGKAVIKSEKNDEDQWELVVELDDAYANAIGVFEEGYQPLTMVADIKTMNPWGFKRIKTNGDVSDIQGYIDQISFYMYMLNTPYGSIFIESKDNNDTLEIQIVWKDMHEDVEYVFDPDIHGEKGADIVRVVIDSERFFGSDTQEGAVQRVDRLNTVKEELEKADMLGDTEALARLMPPRCAAKPDAFPCSWGHKTGVVQYCEYYEHCWNPNHHGLAVKTFEACPPEAIWEFVHEADGEGDVVQVDSRKVPAGVTEEAFLALVEAGVLDYSKFLVDDIIMLTVEEASEAVMGADELFGAGGELVLTAPPKPATSDMVEEYQTPTGDRAIACGNCKKEVTYTRLGAGNKKACPHCKFTNIVVRH